MQRLLTSPGPWDRHQWRGIGDQTRHFSVAEPRLCEWDAVDGVGAGAAWRHWWRSMVSLSSKPCCIPSISSTFSTPTPASSSCGARLDAIITTSRVAQAPGGADRPRQTSAPSPAIAPVPIARNRSGELRPGEEESKGERQVLMHTEKLLQITQGSGDLLYAGEDTVVERLGACSQHSTR